MQFFFAENTESDIFQLSEEESAHCIRVLRKAVGDTLHVVDGHGTLCVCTILEAHPKHCTVQVVERQSGYGRRPFALHLAVAPTKNAARLEWLVEKAVEMGVESITPIVCQHSERCVMKRERLDKIAISAMKQSLKAFLPIIHDPTPLADLLDEAHQSASLNHHSTQRFIAYCDGDHRTPLRDAYTPGSDALILIGPEGDFSPDEVHHALAAGFVPVTLGTSRLRTETAALAAIAFLNLYSN
ncbi:MAG: 16S rRNA (uracil(1498)-N(3))-methyltransferase [Bacteroidales bacterium]|nr:16S rRNA (uracil(1498)-N(3))-methyltransferase [Bacteroidales bacterium]